MAARWFLTIDGEFVQLDADDMPGEMWPLSVTQGGTGLDHLGTTNSLLVVGGPTGLFWRKLVPDNIQPEYRSGDGDHYIIGTLQDLTDGDVLVREGESWINASLKDGIAHNLLSFVHKDTEPEDAERGGTIRVNEDNKWEQLPLGEEGQVLQSNGEDLVYDYISKDNVAATDKDGTGNKFVLADTADLEAFHLLQWNGDEWENAFLTVPNIDTGSITDNGAGDDLVVTTVGPTSGYITGTALFWTGTGYGNWNINGANGLESANGSSEKIIRPTTQTGYWALPFEFVQTVGTQAVTAANNVFALRSYLPCRLTVNSIHFSMNSNAGGDSYSVGLYDTAGTTKLLTSSVFTSGVGDKDTTLGATVTLDPGFYWCAFTASNTSATFRTATLGTNVRANLNSGTVQFCLAGNSSAAGVLPATLGTLTTSSGLTAFPFVKLQS